MTTPCAFCGFSDSRHRIVDSVLERIAAGEEPAEVLDDFGWSLQRFAEIAWEVYGVVEPCVKVAADEETT